MGIWDIIKKKLANESEQHHADYSDTASKNVYDIAAFDMNNAPLADKINYLLDNRSQGEQIQFADKLLREGPFEVSIRMYEALIKKYPEERDRYEHFIGTAYLKLGQHENAVQYYTTARSHGMHPEISDKNIWDACNKHYATTQRIDLVAKYPSFSPEGKYLPQAKEIMISGGMDVEEVEKLISCKSPSTFVKPVDAVSGKENLIVETPQIEEEVAKKDKVIPENQFSLFGEEPAQEISVPEVEPVQEVVPETIDEIPVVEEKEEIVEEVPFSVTPDMLTALDFHIDQFFDNEEVVVWKDKRDDDLKIDIYHIKPSESRNFHLLISFGMARKPMNTPEGAEAFRYAELVTILPEDWDLSPEGMRNPNNYWPVLWLKNLARIPQQYNSWLCYGHSIPNGDPAEPIADTEFEGVLVMDSVTLPEDFQEVKVGDNTLYLFTVIPVYKNELEFKIEHGINELVAKFGEAGIPDWIIPGRPEAV